MIGNAEYGYYVPDKVAPKLLSREFLLAVNNIYNFYQLVAYVDPELYRKLQATEKEQSGQKNLCQWNEYKVKINKGIFEKMKRFTPIDK